MNSRVSRIAAGAVVSALAIASLAGCTSSEPGDPTTGEPVVLQYWSWAPNIDKIVDVWNESHPDVQVEVNTSVGAADIVAKLSAAKEAGSLPDLSNTTYENLPNLVVNGIAADITEAFGGYEDEIAPAAWDLTTFDGKNYAVPQGTGPQFLFYRTDIFESLGLEAPTTWDEYAAAARTIHTADSSKYLATFPANDAQLFAALSAQAGAQWWSQEDGVWSVGIADADATKVADYWQGLVDEGVVTTLKTWTPEWQAALADGTIASWLSAVWAPPLILQNAPETAGLWGAVRLPQWQAGDSVSAALGGSGTVVTTGTEHAEEAQEFAIWLNNSTDALNAYIENASIWPANLAGRELPGIKDTAPAALAPGFEDFYDVAAEIDDETVPVTWGPDVALAYSAFGDAFGTAITQKSSFGDALTTVQDAVVADMTKLGFTVE
ncbi:ABC transporter substrate-binding protein [Microbacterium invictum]|uniref:Multiple sugar transport system substrate-binding protein n=1 Tax=Microbacterium invictum TaxID=515415 RepID=A0AA40SRN1_9MICO|nr:MULTISPECIES: extracellular solute-binding protein [Microbacterium]MBB4141186.1 multiple sugar transport system substrate-binding protein [Microbacterium invictum]